MLLQTIPYIFIYLYFGLNIWVFSYIMLILFKCAWWTYIWKEVTIKYYYLNPLITNLFWWLSLWELNDNIVCWLCMLNPNYYWMILCILLYLCIHLGELKIWSIYYWMSIFLVWIFAVTIFIKKLLLIIVIYNHLFIWVSKILGDFQLCDNIAGSHI